MFNSYWLYPSLPEWKRAGVFHLGFGSRYYRTAKEFQEYAPKDTLPAGRIHIHNYFATFEVKLQGTDYWYKIIDKGRITAMDEPEVRSIASKYGIPDQLLSYDWISPCRASIVRGIICKTMRRTRWHILKGALQKISPFKNPFGKVWKNGEKRTTMEKRNRRSFKIL